MPKAAFIAMFTNSFKGVSILPRRIFHKYITKTKTNNIVTFGKIKSAKALYPS